MSENIDELEKELLKLISKDGILMSLLYDLDLLPEQLQRQSRDWVKMLTIIAHWKSKADSLNPQPKEDGL